MGQSLADGRFRIERFTRSTSFAEIYDAVDTSDNRAVSVQLVHDKLLASKEVAAAIESAAAAARAVRQKHLVGILEAGRHEGRLFVVTELVEGNSLRELLERKRRTGGGGFGVRGTRNILSSLCEALSALHQHNNAHGGIGIDAVFVNKAGRVKLVDVGLAAAMAAAVRAGLAQPPSSMAPEVARAGRPTPSGDLFSAGHLLYELLVGQPLRKGGPRPSEIEGVGSMVDELIARCVAAPDKRPQSTETLKDALLRAFAQPVEQKQPRPQAPQPSLAESISQPQSSGQPEGALAAAMADAEERWLISKGKLDYGPFTLAAVVEEINSNQVLPGHLVIDKHTGERVAVEDHPLLGEVVEAAKQRRDDTRRAEAEVAHASSEKRRGLALYGFIGVGVIVLGSIAYVVVNKLSKDKKSDEGGIASVESGKLTAKFRFPEKAAKKRRGRRGRSRRAGGAAEGGDDVNRLDMSEEGGDERLDSHQINSVVSRYGNRLGRCMVKTGSRSAAIRFIIKGSGRVSWVQVNGKRSGGLYSCVSSVIRSMQFPTFDGSRTRAEFNMSL